MSKIKAIISLSGGIDSATVLAEALEQGRDCTAVGFCYGSKHNRFENLKAKQLADYYGVPFQIFNLEGIFSLFKSDLLLNGGEIPEGHYESESMKSTVVPGRNLIFISILAGLAQSIDATVIWLGIHSGDHAIYPDCRPEFFYAARDTISKSSEGKVLLYAPYLDTNKIGILRIGTKLNVPYHLTRTCYKDQKLACGKCGSCQERLEAFKANNTKDPIQYEGNENG